MGGFEPAVTAVHGTAPTSMTSPPPAPVLNGTLADISKQLGMSVSSVQGALKQGQSVTELAQQQGVSRDALVKLVEKQIQANRQANGQLPIDQSTLDRLVTRAFDHHRRAHGAGAAGSTINPAVAAFTRSLQTASGSFSTLA